MLGGLELELGEAGVAEHARLRRVARLRHGMVRVERHERAFDPSSKPYAITGES